MKNKVFMYLFVFTLLIALFIYISQKKIYERQLETIDSLEQKIGSLLEEMEYLRYENEDLNYFTFQGNDNAMTYYENQGYEPQVIEDLVREHIYAQNVENGGNPLIPYEGMEGTMKINKVRFLNHKWVIADFTDGRYWGEIILQYDIDETKNLTLNTVQSVLYPF